MLLFTNEETYMDEILGNGDIGFFRAKNERTDEDAVLYEFAKYHIATHGPIWDRIEIRDKLSQITIEGLAFLKSKIVAVLKDGKNRPGKSISES